MTNGRFRIMLAHHRGPYKASLALALMILLALFVFFPPFEFTPYQLQAEEEITVIEVAQDVVIPPPPKEDPQPPVRVDQDLDGEEVDEIPENAPKDWDDVWVAPPPGPGGERGYIVFDELPVPEYIVRPVYPRLAREAGIEGTVLLQVKVGLDHKIHEATVLSSDVTPAMEKAAIAAALQCRYKPAKQQGVEVEVWVSIRINFRLN